MLLHGLGGDIGFWTADVEVWREGFEVIAVDLRGSGETPGTPGPFTMADLADDIAAVIDDRGVDRAHVVGFSLGGLVAQVLAFRHPARVARLVLASTYACMSGQSRLFLDAVLAGYERDRSAGQMFALICPWLFSAAFVDDPDNAAWFELPDEAEADQTMENWRALYHAQHVFDGRDDLPTITAETLILAGGEDALVPLAAAQFLADRIPRAAMHLFPAAGHLINVEEPARFRSAIRGFLLNAS